MHVSAHLGPNSPFDAAITRPQQTVEPQNGARIQRLYEPDVVGVLVSGGLDSCILLKYLLDTGRRVKPFYVRSGLCWQAAEMAALQRYLDEVKMPWLEPLTVLDMPLSDVYGDHWSITGKNVPGTDTPDEAIFLPGRNVLLIAKAALWCQMHDIGRLGLATLNSNPFGDATAAYFDQLADVLSRMWPRPIRLLRPFGQLDKQQVMEIGRGMPLGLTFSCIAPRDGAHCGQCNKCAERQAAFRLSDLADPTTYDQSTCCVSVHRIPQE